MKNYKIRKLSIENFKHVDNFSIDFSGKDLIVFDGPNGFGKTTLFDALELVISGGISRVTNTVDGRYGYNDLLFSNQNNKDTIIKIEFYNENENFTIVKRYNANKSIRPLDRKPDNWNLFETYLLEKFDSPLSEGEPISTEVLHSKLGMRSLHRYFSLFYYVQQEENTYFLKKNAKDRMDSISQLFDTNKEELELKKLNSLKMKLETEYRKINEPNGLLTQKNKLLHNLTTGILKVDKDKLTQVEYFQLLSNNLEIKEWDKKDISIQKETRDRFLQELRDIYKLVRDFGLFLKVQTNEEIQKYADNTLLLDNTIISMNFLGKYAEFQKLKIKERKLKSLKEKLNKEKIRENELILSTIELKALITQPIDVETIQDKIRLLNSYKKNMSEISSLLQDINATRDTLLTHFNNMNHLIGNQQQECPLCGNDWDSYTELIKNIQIKSKTFQKHYDSSTRQYEVELNNLFKDHLDPIITWIDQYLNEPNNIIDEEFFNQLTKSIKESDSVIKFAEWCQKHDIELSPFLNQDISVVGELEYKREKLQELLLTKKYTIENNYTEHEEKKNIYIRIFNSKSEEVRNLKLTQIEDKAKYIEYQYYHRSSKNIDILHKEIESLELKSKKIEYATKKFKDIIKVYEDRILYHWKKIIRDIEIPLYIYSGKILQDYQRGRGIFLQESDSYGIKSIKFISDYNSDHDAVNYLSSGQLSGLVIALTLALNKVYGNDSINILLIDDPVQTMDEINMASFVELLRNEFRDKQIFLSTHEEDISRYMRYKFSKYNLNTLRVNVKDRLLLPTDN